MTRKIAIVTGTRAEYGLLKRLIRRVQESELTELQLVVTGAHLSPEFGMTVSEIEADGFPIADRLDMLLSSDSAVGVTKATGLGMIGFADSFRRLDPDVVVLLGDRFEILGAAAAALFASIPIAHLHGGETTEGAFDEAIRHSVTKMAHLHFVAAEPYRRRVVQLGEDPARVFEVGGLGLDAIADLEAMPRAELERSLGWQFGAESLLVTYHPETIAGLDPATQLNELLAALDLRPKTHLLFTLPNADTGGRALIARIEDYVATRANAVAHCSLGQHRYLSALRYVDGVVGNSSSGLLEAPSFGIGTVDIGERQAGRLAAASVVRCAPKRTAIAAQIACILSAEFRSSLAGVANPYGSGGATDAIFAVLSDCPLDNLLRKRFHDIVAENCQAVASTGEVN
ncbi:UDP-N-acetyl-D-glucosamine 2-epimerase, UDP-hydrolysing [Erythrobacter sp. QSSC1-22B]|uniref:UDP-N-acetylglucosamine 2-epimerase n=1 Tax=Erythrobacter sp. QSSC1-22B TaxID=1860125 RepID=UPI000804D228|nr:UDP-N-acetylglucosamine 2-epimerase [Erythrobacter sp. QSSC1-22B]OBX19907.1 UDP-N-acetyl-D-glucosamine 2-epimerase, UDP-hydrolysing [Erythrobacter sp. QSSC1-22B]